MRHLVAIWRRRVLIISRKGRSILRAQDCSCCCFCDNSTGVSHSSDKILVIVIGLEAIEGEEVRPRGGSFRLAGMHRLEQVVVYHVKLRADVVGATITNKTNGASMEEPPCIGPVETEVRTWVLFFQARV
jgi:hypothetical protein